jgi:hypothetical protein
VLLAASVLSVAGALWQHRRMQQKAARGAGSDGDTDF